MIIKEIKIIKKKLKIIEKAQAKVKVDDIYYNITCIGIVLIYLVQMFVDSNLVFCCVATFGSYRFKLLICINSHTVGSNLSLIFKNLWLGHKLNI